MRQTTVRTVMTADPATVGPDTPFKEIVQLLAERAVSAVPVVDQDGVPVGVVSEADLLVRTEKQGRSKLGWLSRWSRHERLPGRSAAELMTVQPLTIGPDETLPEAARVLSAAGVRRLLVVDGDGRLIGVVARRDLLRPFLLGDDRLRSMVREDVLWRALWLKPAEVRVEVDEGVVTLAGTVERRSEAELAARLADALPGVVGVQNQLAYTWDDVGGDLGTSNLLH